MNQNLLSVQLNDIPCDLYRVKLLLIETFPDLHEVNASSPDLYGKITLENNLDDIILAITLSSVFNGIEIHIAYVSNTITEPGYDSQAINNTMYLALRKMIGVKYNFTSRGPSKWLADSVNRAYELCWYMFHFAQMTWKEKIIEVGYDPTPYETDPIVYASTIYRESFPTGDYYSDYNMIKNNLGYFYARSLI